ncbi:MAG: hypothetical protein J0H55_08440 [Chitinophagaceae bacterium]|nr:hypothetical protein [Chitinophagaceae bacterium]
MEKLFKQYAELKKQYFSYRIDFAKHFITLSSALIAVLIALKPPSAHNNLSFFLTLMLLMGCILFGAAFLYIVLMQHRRMDSDFLAQMREMLHDPHKNFEGVFAKYNKWQLFVESGLYLSFLMALVCLVIHRVY